MSMNKYFEYKKLMQNEMMLYQKKLYDELKSSINILKLKKYDIKSVHGIKSKLGNDRTDYMWIKLITNNNEYWLSLFYNEIDQETGNMHTQIGRIQFCKDIKNKTPNSNIVINNNKVWYMNLEKYSEPKKGASFVGDDVNYITKEFLNFVKNNLKETE